MTEQLLGALAIRPNDAVVEVAPGLGATTQLILDAQPDSYVGVDRDPASADLVASLMSGPNRRVVNASASDTGLPDDSADVVFGEAYLTMQPDSMKHRIIGELARVTRPGGRFALHEVAYRPDADAAARERVAGQLQSTIKVNVSPMPESGWEELLTEHGFTVTKRVSAPLHLLEPRRLIADEGLANAFAFVRNVVRDKDARARVRSMRRAMSGNGRYLQAYGLVATRVDDAA